MTIRKTIARAVRRLTGRPAGERSLTPVDLRALALAANRYFYLGPELALVRLNCGPMLYVDPLDEHVSANIIVHGFWEASVHEAVMSLLQPGDHVVEVGANLGYYTVTMADAVGSGGHITALEANPRLSGLIRRSLNLNGFAPRATVVPRAALDQPGEIDFVVSRRNSGGGYVTLWEDNPYEDGQTIKVEAVRIDDLGLGRVDLIRIDAEGSEPFILRGAEGVLRANPDIVICMEWSVIQMESRTSVKDLLTWMGGLGFSFWRIEKDASLTPVAPVDLEGAPHCDIVASRRPLRRA